MGSGAAPGDQILNAMEAIPMTRRCAGSGLMLAGVIVTVVGLTVALMRTWHIPGYWTTLAVGIALLLGGAIRAVGGRRREPDTRTA